jgi:hypothetical protein
VPTSSKRAVLTSTIVALCALAAVARAETPRLISASYLGTSKSERLLGVQIASDASIFASLRVADVDAAGAETFVESRVLRLSKDARKVLWDVKVPEDVRDLRIDDKDVVYAFGLSRVHKLAPANGALLASSEPYGSEGIDFSLSTAGEIAVMAGGDVIKYATDTLKETLRFGHGIPTRFSVLLDREGGVYAGGDSNPGTGCEPYRVPKIFHFDKTGKRDWRFWDYPGPLVRLMAQFQADSSVIDLDTDDKGRLWFVGQSDGYNTVFTQKYWNMKEKNPFLNSSCYPSACLYPRGARKFTVVGRLLETYNEVGRATWWAPFAESQRESAVKPPEGYMAWAEKQPLCGAATTASPGQRRITSPASASTRGRR